MDDFLESSFSEDSDAVDEEVEAALYSMVHHSSDTYEWVYETNMLQFSESYINSASRWEAYKEIESRTSDNYIMNSQEINEALNKIPFIKNEFSNESNTIFDQQFNRRGHNVNDNRNNHRNEKPGNVHDRIRNRSHDPDFVQRNEVDQQYSVDPQAVPKIHNFSSFERNNLEDLNRRIKYKGTIVGHVEYPSKIPDMNTMIRNISGVKVSTAISNVVAISDSEANDSSGESVVEVAVPPKPPPPLVSLDSSDELDNSDEVMIVDSKKSQTKKSNTKKPTNKKSQSKKSQCLRSRSKKPHSKKRLSNKPHPEKPSRPLVCYSSSSYSSSPYNSPIDSSDELKIVIHSTKNRSKKHHSKKHRSKKPSPPLVGLDSSDELEMDVDSETSRVLNVSENNKLTIDSAPSSQSTPVKSESYTNPFFGSRINNPIKSTSKEIKNKKKKNYKRLNYLKRLNNQKRLNSFKKCTCPKSEHFVSSNKACLKCGKPSLHEGCPCLNHNCAKCGDEKRCKFSLKLNCFCAGKGHLAAECSKRSEETSSSTIPSRRDFKRSNSV